MSNGGKFVLIMFMLFTFGALFLTAIVIQNEGEGEGVAEMVLVLIGLWATGALVHRRHVNRNAWLSEAMKARMRYVVTLYGPIGWLGYYSSHVHPHDEDAIPPASPPPDAPYTDADRLL